MFYIVLGVYAVAYLVLFVVPAVKAATDLRPGASLGRLKALLADEAEAAEALRRDQRFTSGDGALEATVSVSQEPPGESQGYGFRAAQSAASEPQDEVEPYDDFAGDTYEEDDPYEEEEEQEEALQSAPAPIRNSQAVAMERLTGHRALVSRYPSPIVQDAVDRVRVQYPGGAYQRVDIDQLPTYLVYAERMGTARTMAGLFVLLGLVLTMTKLNGVVGQIARATEASATQAQFIDLMADIMGNISGAFVASIWGLWLMLVALAILAIIDFFVQRSVADIDRAFAGHVVPELAALHQSLSPELSLGDLLARTGTSLGSLNTTVDGLTVGMADSLSKLGVQIREMLQDFGRFERHYVQLDGLLHSIGKAGEDLQKVTGGLEGATRRLAEPLDDFNQNVGKHLELVRTHLETVGDATAANIEGYRETSEQLLTVKVHTDEIVQAIQNLVTTRVDGLETRQVEALRELQSHMAETNARIASLVGTLEKAPLARPSPSAMAPVFSGGTRDLPPTLFLWVAGGVLRLADRFRARR